ncbi:hypothetical protein BG006_010199 [Podila minutissima]|uniref:L domain-like protein n=1 Tax=Podila minutissima TaxID=64525 RepID=A0A9P5SH90_9FUNG|nr:hypothetical protein BG006_010199 [Podila minutissima]
MGNIYSITLCDRDLHHVPDDIYKHHKHVAKLLLRRNNIQEIPPDIKVLTNLLELSLRDNLLSSVPVEITNLKLLQKLSLANNRFHEPPAPIAAFSQLTWLSLASNTLTWLPDSFSQLQKLTSLDLQRNRFTAIPDCVFELKSLTILLLQKNRITTISPKIGQCTQLVSLNLSYNRLQHLPIEMKECKGLQHLLLSVNTIQALPAILCASWTNLLNLDLHTNDLKVLPDQLGAMKSLRRLNLAINKIDVIPVSIGRLSLLEWLNLNDNKLTTLPSTMDQMQKLVKMGIVQNKLQTLPAALAKLSALYKLDCRRNEIEFLPSSFKELQGIHSLLLEENPLSFRYGVSNYSRQPPSLLELAARSVLDRYCPQERALSTQSSSSSSSSTSSSCPSPQPDTGAFNTATDTVSVMGIAHLIPTMADLGLTKGSTITPPHSVSSTPPKSRYNFFSRACATVHPSPSKPSRSSTISSASSTSTSSSSSSSASSAPAPSISSSLTGSSLAQGAPPPYSPAEIGRFSRKRLSPKPIKGRSFFHKPSILQSQNDGPKKNHTLLDNQPQQPTPQGQGHCYQSTRKIHKSRLSQLLDPETSLLPLAVIDLLGQSITPCDYCERRMCSSGWVDFLEPAKLGTSRMIVPVRHRMCSLQCVRQQYRDSFGGEMTDSFETTDFHIGHNGEMVGSRPIVPGELDEYMIEAVQEAADHAGISITHLLEQYHQHQRSQQASDETATSSVTAAQETETPPVVDAPPGSISMMAINQMVSASGNSGQSATTPLAGPASLIRQTTARLRRSLSRPLTPVEIQIDAQGQLRRVVYRQARNTSHRRRFLETFRSLSQVGQGNGTTGLGVLTAAGIGANPGLVGGNGGPGFAMGQGDATAVSNRGANNRAGEVMNVTTFAVELERF